LTGEKIRVGVRRGVENRKRVKVLVGFWGGSPRQLR